MACVFIYFMSLFWFIRKSTDEASRKQLSIKNSFKIIIDFYRIFVCGSQFLSVVIEFISTLYPVTLNVLYFCSCLVVFHPYFAWKMSIITYSKLAIVFYNHFCGTVFYRTDLISNFFPLNLLSFFICKIYYFTIKHRFCVRAVEMGRSIWISYVSHSFIRDTKTETYIEIKTNITLNVCIYLKEPIWLILFFLFFFFTYRKEDNFDRQYLSTFGGRVYLLI